MWCGRECAVWDCWAGFKGVLLAVSNVLPGVPRTSLDSHKAAGVVGPSVEPRVGDTVCGYWVDFQACFWQWVVSYLAFLDPTWPLVKMKTSSKVVDGNVVPRECRLKLLDRLKGVFNRWWAVVSPRVLVTTLASGSVIFRFLIYSYFMCIVQLVYELPVAIFPTTVFLKGSCLGRG